MSRSRRTAPVVGATLALLALSPAAWSFFTSAGTGTGTAVVDTLAAPSNVAGSPSGDAVVLTWVGPLAPGGGAVDGYYVQRSSGAPGGTCASSATSLLPASPTGCTDAAVPAATHTYTVVAVYRSWTASAAGAPVTVSAPPVAVDRFDVGVPATATAGSAFDVTITARTAGGPVATGYAGAKTLTSSGPGTAPGGATPTLPVSVTFTGGVATASVTLVRAETATLTVSEGGASGTSAGVVVGHGGVSRFDLVASTPQVAGTPFGVSATAYDTFGNPATGYSGAKSVAWSGAASSPGGTPATLPESVNFANGAGSATVTLARAGSTVLTATDGGASGSATIQVDAGAAARLAWSFTAPTAGAGCVFDCTFIAGNNADVVGRVSVTDGLGNVVSNLGSGHTVTLSGVRGTVRTALPLAVAATGPAQSVAFTYRTDNGSWTTDTLTASKAVGAAYTSVVATLHKTT